MTKQETPESEAAAKVNAEAEAAKNAAEAAAKNPVATAKPEKVAKAKALTVVVTGPEKGRWRAGRRFTREPVSIPQSELTDHELAMLEGDPELSVRIIDAPH